MRYKMPLESMTPGLTRMAAALMGGDAAQQQGYDSAMQGQSKMAQALAAIEAARANADKDYAAADETRAKTGVLQQRPQQYVQQSALAAGVDMPTISAYLAKLSGQAPTVPMGPPAEDGLMGVGSAQFGAESDSKIRQALQRMFPIQANTGDFKVDDWAKAQGAYREQDLGNDVLAGRRTAADVGRSQAAVAAKPMFNADSTGSVLDLFGGALDTSNPMAQSTIGLRKEQAGAQKANAVQSYASAAKTRQEMTDGMGAGGKAPTGYRWAADGRTLETIPGGPADPNTKGSKLAKPPTEGQSKALLFGARMAIADDVLSELEKGGKRLPSLLKKGVEGIPLVGEGLGMVANGFASEGQQQVEQAQRDFINAVLRRESGAAIAPSEFANAQKQYFPQPNDSAAVLRQKASNRKTAVSGMKAEFGEASMPQFENMVNEARQSRKAPGAADGGASGSWGDGFTIERVN